MANQPGGPTEVHSWIAGIFAQFRDLELRLILGALESSLRGNAPGTLQQPRETDETSYR
jgi:hypothetical protein